MLLAYTDIYDEDSSMVCWAIMPCPCAFVRSCTWLEERCVGLTQVSVVVVVCRNTCQVGGCSSSKTLLTTGVQVKSSYFFSLTFLLIILSDPHTSVGPFILTPNIWSRLIRRMLILAWSWGGAIWLPSSHRSWSSLLVILLVFQETLLVACKRKMRSLWRKSGHPRWSWCCEKTPHSWRICDGPGDSLWWPGIQSTLSIRNHHASSQSRQASGWSSTLLRLLLRKKMPSALVTSWNVIPKHTSWVSYVEHLDRSLASIFLGSLALCLLFWRLIRTSNESSVLTSDDSGSIKPDTSPPIWADHPPPRLTLWTAQRRSLLRIFGGLLQYRGIRMDNTSHLSP